MDTKKWTTQIDKTTDDFKKSLGSLTFEQLNWKPSLQTWSIGQNIDHLIVINQTYLPIISSIRNGTYRLPFIGKFSFIVSFLGKILLQSVKPDRKKRMKTFPVWEPTRSEIGVNLFERFERNQVELKNMIENSVDLLDQGTIISSPANSNIVYKLETAFDIIVTHEQRHFEQAKEVGMMLKN